MSFRTFVVTCLVFAVSPISVGVVLQKNNGALLWVFDNYSTNEKCTFTASIGAGDQKIFLSYDVFKTEILDAKKTVLDLNSIDKNSFVNLTDKMTAKDTAWQYTIVPKCQTKSADVKLLDGTTKKAMIYTNRPKEIRSLTEARVAGSQSAKAQLIV